MRWALYLTVATSSLIIGNDRLAGPAFAVMGERVVGPAAPQNPDAERAVTRLDIPVAWQLTRSKLMGPGATTLTESFRESWTIEMTTSGRMFLESPRARVPAYAASNTELKTADLPRIVVLSERDLARLVGIQPATETADDEAETLVEPLGRPVSLTLIASGKNALDLTLAWNDDEHYAIHLDIGTSTTF